jgi:hypothetical protein
MTRIKQSFTDIPNDEECFNCGRWFKQKLANCPYCKEKNPDHNPYTRYKWGESKAPTEKPVDNPPLAK